MKKFHIGQKVTPLTPRGDVDWGIVEVSGTTKKVPGPEAGGVYIVSGYDDRCSKEAIYLAEFPCYDEYEPGFASDGFREVKDEEFSMVNNLMKRLGVE